MKNTVMGITAVAMMVAITPPTFAAEKADSQKNKTYETTWKHNGVNIHHYSNHALSKNDKESLEKVVDSLSTGNSGGSVTPNYIPAPDNPGTTIEGPSYKTYDNSVTNQIIRYAIDGVSVAIARTMGATPYGQFASAVAADWLSNARGYLNSHPYVYEMFKTYYAYDSYWGRNEVYELQVNYAYSNYTSPTDVYNYDSGLAYSSLR
ncbi:hypothetical protein [Tumebacillus permanentifrigoris]|uniref:Uncharacterized protein n=1 Tax=Tumebacillus permanentifrigoris TaxID=378543 RepID=A0A316DA26_9BACL|nr:hypothetical protein [Tumebacillus permanentifrigoris]PWK13958.1 hypothetical protein C7459_106256 [Tumebacillus permanentifrigoris]